jgi:hypothetical protein
MDFPSKTANGCRGTERVVRRRGAWSGPIAADADSRSDVVRTDNPAEVAETPTHEEMSNLISEKEGPATSLEAKPPSRCQTCFAQRKNTV